MLKSCVCILIEGKAEHACLHTSADVSSRTTFNTVVSLYAEAHLFTTCATERDEVWGRGEGSLCGPRGLYETSLCILRCPKMLFLTHELVCVGFFFFCPPAITLVFFFLRVFRFLSKVMLWCCREYSVLSSAAVFWSIFFLAAFLYLFPSCTAHGKGSQHLSGLSGALLEHKELYHSTDTELMMHR